MSVQLKGYLQCLSGKKFIWSWVLQTRGFLSAGQIWPSSSGDWNVVNSQAFSLRRIHPWWWFGVMSGLLTHLFLYVLADYSSLLHPSGLQICELLFCCWDKNTTAKVTYRKRVYFNWWLQRAENLSWWEGMTSSNRHGSRNMAPSPGSIKQRAKKEVVWWYNLPVVCFLQQGSTPNPPQTAPPTRDHVEVSSALCSWSVSLLRGLIGSFTLSHLTTKGIVTTWASKIYMCLSVTLIFDSVRQPIPMSATTKYFL